MQPAIEQNAKAERPRNVTRAVQFLASSLAIGLLTSIFRLTQRTSGAPMLLALLLVIVFFGLLFFLVMKVSAGRNWARIVVLILVLFVPFAIPAYLEELRRNAFSGTLSIIIVLLQLSGTYLLFTRKSNIWFRTRK